MAISLSGFAGRWTPAGRFALIAALCSSVGQTFFIGLFGGEFRRDFALSETQLGLFYGLATLCSGLLMFWLGSIADRWSLSRGMFFTLAVLALGAAVLAWSPGTAWLVAGLFLVRLGGQGLCGHLAVVAAARYAGRYRGRSVAMATYGFILGEAAFPLSVAWALGVMDWRSVWGLSALLVVLLAMPILLWLARPLVQAGTPVAPSDTDSPQVPLMARRKLLRHPGFLRVLTVVLVPPVVVTAVFLHSGTLAEQLDWRLADLARGFLLFAAIQGLFAFAGGRLIDRFSARALLRFSLLPAGFGLLGLSLLSPSMALWGLFAGLGMTAGMNGVISGAVWVELFGTAQLGMIRGVYAALMVISTAVGPVVLGVLFAGEVSLAMIAMAYLAYALSVPLLVVPGLFDSRLRDLSG